MERRFFLAAIVLAVGCGQEQGPAQLEVEMLSIGGAVGGTTVPGTDGATASGQREGDQGTFFVEGPNLTVQLSACPLGDLQNTDPYGTGGIGDPRGGPTPVPIADDAGVSDTTGLITGVDCLGRSLMLCGAHSCGQFTGDEVDLQIVEESGWRHVTVDANNATGDVQIALRYRETH